MSSLQPLALTKPLGQPAADTLLGGSSAHHQPKDTTADKTEHSDAFRECTGDATGRTRGRQGRRKQCAHAMHLARHCCGKCLHAVRQCYHYCCGQCFASSRSRSPSPSPDLSTHLLAKSETSSSSLAAAQGDHQPPPEDTSAGLPDLAPNPDAVTKLSMVKRLAQIDVDVRTDVYGFVATDPVSVYAWLATSPFQALS